MIYIIRAYKSYKSYKCILIRALLIRVVAIINHRPSKLIISKPSLNVQSNQIQSKQKCEL